MGTADEEVVYRLVLDSRQANVALGRTRKASDDAATAQGKLGKSLNDSTKNALKFAAAYVSVQAAFQAFDLGKQAAQFEDARKIFEASGNSLEDFRRATRGMVSDAQLVKQANMAEVMGINATAFKQFARIATASSKITGRDFGFLLESIIGGTARMEKEILDNLGIIVSAKEAYKNFAGANGLVATKLTDVQKRMAFTSEVMAKGEVIIKKAAAAGDSAAAAFNQMETDVTNLKLAIGDGLMPGLRTMISFFRDDLLPVLGEGKKAFAEFLDASLWEKAKIVNAQFLNVATRGLVDLREETKLASGELRAEFEAEATAVQLLATEINRLNRSRAVMLKLSTEAFDPQALLDLDATIAAITARRLALLQGGTGTGGKPKKDKGRRQKEKAEEISFGQQLELDNLAFLIRVQQEARDFKAETMRQDEADFDRRAELEREQLSLFRDIAEEKKLQLEKDREDEQAKFKKDQKEKAAVAQAALQDGISTALRFTNILAQGLVDVAAGREDAMQMLLASVLSAIGQEAVARGTAIALEGAGQLALTGGIAGGPAVAAGLALAGFGVGRGAAGGGLGAVSGGGGGVGPGGFSDFSQSNRRAGDVTRTPGVNGGGNGAEAGGNGGDIGQGGGQVVQQFFLAPMFGDFNQAARTTSSLQRRARNDLLERNP